MDSVLVAGHAAGRLKPEAYTAPDGSYVLLLGAEDPNVEEDVEVGDYASVNTTFDVTDLTLLTFALRFRNTASVSGPDFKVVVELDGTELWSEQIPRGELRQYAKRTVNVAPFDGNAHLEIRLEAVA